MEALHKSCFRGDHLREIQRISKGTTVRAEIITEVILDRAGPVFFETSLLELIAFRLEFVLQVEQSLKITGNGNKFQTGPILQ